MKKTKLLFICLGNICRSPAAEGIAKKILGEEKYEIDSAGTGSWHAGDHPDSRSITICKKHGIDISQQTSRKIRFIDPEYFDTIIAMDSQNVLDLQNIIPKKYHYKIRKLDERKDIADPYFGGENGFEEMYQHIKNAIENL